MNLTVVKNKPLLRYLVVGSLAFLCEYGVFYLFYVTANWNLFLANTLSFLAGLCTSFTLNRLWTFRKENFHRKIHHQAAMYLVLAFVNLFISNILIGGLKGAGLDPRLGKIVAIGTIAIWNFVLFKTVIFKGKQTISI
jgi:putative flippase GtrA